MYERFREILSCNDATLQLIADIEDRLSGRAPVAIESLARRARKAAMDAFVMVKNLNQISGNSHAELYPVLLALSAEIERASPSTAPAADCAVVLPLDRLTLHDAGAAGTKMARLGEVRARSGLAVPDGFVVTTAAFATFMSANELWERALHLEDLLDRGGLAAAFTRACHEVEAAILAAAVPEAVAAPMLDAFDGLAAGRPIRVAVRSSAVGEDTRASHAGQYRTELHVDRDGLLTAYRAVVASAYSPAAVAYRYERGMTAPEAGMAVGCIRMVEPRCSGVMFSRPADAQAGDAVVISAVRGVSAALASGELGSQVWIAGDDLQMPDSTLLSRADVGVLAEAARRLEEDFHGPQEIEWALDADGLFILQSRPMTAAPEAPAASGAPLTDDTPILVGGQTACPGVGAGPVVPVDREEELDLFPDGGVLVARHASPAYSRVLSRCAAVVTDIGSATGHMASLAREYAVPAIVGTGRATSFLQPGERVTVDATRREVFAGTLTESRRRPAAPAPTDTPALQALRRIARLVTPLSLTDPASRDFAPAACRSLHDITRYVHEKTFAVMFHCGDIATSDVHAHRVDVRLPFTIHVFDVGGGLRGDPPPGEPADARPPGAAGRDEADGRVVRMDDIVCEPMLAFLSGLLDDRVRWDRPRPLSARGFLAVVGERMAGLPGEALKVGGASYAIISDRYLNFSTKAGYHFSTVDTYCGQSLNKNYVHFRFSGGAADEPRRVRRIRFIHQVLVHLDFRVQARSDLLVARIEKLAREPLLARLQELGRLTLCCRQLDMLMNSDTSADHFARAFLAGEMERF